MHFEQENAQMRFQSRHTALPIPSWMKGPTPREWEGIKGDGKGAGGWSGWEGKYEGTTLFGAQLQPLETRDVEDRKT